MRRILFAMNIEGQLLRLLDQHTDGIIRILGKQPHILAAASMSAEAEGSDREEQQVEQLMRRIMRASIERQRVFGLRMPGLETEED